MKKKLSEIANIQFGLYSNDFLVKGEVKYVQAKHFDQDVNFTPDEINYLSIDKKNESHILTDGDILFVGKGMRNFAWTYRKEYGLSIASSIFYVIRVCQTNVLPDYLTILFNSPFYQNAFQQLGAGSSIPSIRKSELEVLMINVPSLEVQNNIVEMNSMYLYDLDISNRIIEEKKKLFTSVLNKLIIQ